MNVKVITHLRGEEWTFTDCTLNYDGTVIQIVHGDDTTTFPLVNVISYTFSESVPS